MTVTDNPTRVVILRDTGDGLVLTNAKWSDGRIVSGDVVNGGWYWSHDRDAGVERCHTRRLRQYSSASAYTAWKSLPYHVVSVEGCPHPLSNYNEVIAWARENVSLKSISREE